LRYLISRLDARQMARFRKTTPGEEIVLDPPTAPPPRRPTPEWKKLFDNEDHWTRLF